MKFAFVAKHRSIWPMACLCEALGVSRLGFPAWLHRSPSKHALYDDALLRAITESFKLSDRTYGARRVWHDVLSDGLSCGLHRIERLMHAMLRVHAQSGVACQKIPENDPSSVPMSLTVSSQPADPIRNEWQTSANIWTAEGWLYVAATVELFSRRVVDPSLNSKIAAQLVTEALIMGTCPPRNILRSDVEFAQPEKEQTILK